MSVKTLPDRTSPARLTIPFNRPSFEGREQMYIAQAIANGHISGDGPFTKRCQAFLEEALGVRRVLLTTSGTHALEMAALLLDIQPGDEVIVPSFTFVSTANAFVLRGARPVFIDIRPDTLNLDEEKLEALVTPRTKAIIPVHYAGVGCEMDRVLEICRRHGVAVVEDNAHGLFATYRARPLGTFGNLAALSFHETKNISCGEGGAIVVNDPELLERAEIIREKGTDRSRFFRGQIDKYSWVDLGSSYLSSDLLAAYLYGQLEARDSIQKKRERIWSYYFAHLREWADAHDVFLPHVPMHCGQSFHMFHLILPTLEDRTALIRHLGERGILAVFHYAPLHRSEMSVRLGAGGASCPVTDAVSDRLLRMPFFNGLTQPQQERVVQAVLDFRFSSTTRPGRSDGESRFPRDAVR